MLTLDPKHPAIDQELIDSFNRYLVHGIPFGSFLEAVVCNDLFHAFARADYVNESRLKEIIAFIYQKFPIGSWGSVERYTAWLAEKQQQRKEQNSSFLYSQNRV